MGNSLGPGSRGHEGSLLVARGRCIVNAMCAKGEERGRRVSGLKKLEGKGGRVKWEENGRYVPSWLGGEDEC